MGLKAGVQRTGEGNACDEPPAKHATSSGAPPSNRRATFSTCLCMQRIGLCLVFNAAARQDLPQSSHMLNTSRSQVRTRVPDGKGHRTTTLPHSCCSPPRQTKVATHNARKTKNKAHGSTSTQQPHPNLSATCRARRTRAIFELLYGSAKRHIAPNTTPPRTARIPT